MSGMYRHSMTSLDLENTRMHSRQIHCFLFRIEFLWEPFALYDARRRLAVLNLCESTVNELII